MYHPEVEWLEDQIPPGNPSVGVLHPVEPLERGMIWIKDKLFSQEVVTARQCCLFYSETLILDGTVPPLSGAEVVADIENQLLLPLLVQNRQGIVSAVEKV